MTEPFYTGEASKPRPLAEHAQRARETWDKIAVLVRDGVQEGEERKPLTIEQRDTLRAAAHKGFWLYPLIELNRGVPR